MRPSQSRMGTHSAIGGRMKTPDSLRVHPAAGAKKYFRSTVAAAVAE